MLVFSSRVLATLATAMALKISFLFKRKLDSRTQSRELKISSGCIDQREPDSDAKVFGLDRIDLRSIRLDRTSFPLKGSEKNLRLKANEVVRSK